jgi:hypothetical protein
LLMKLLDREVIAAGAHEEESVEISPS